MENVTTQALKKAVIKQASEHDIMVVLALFIKELEDDLEVAQHIVSEYAHAYPQHVQLHMRNMLEAQLKLNAGMGCLVNELLQHVATLTELGVEDEAKAAINKAMLH